VHRGRRGRRGEGGAEGWGDAWRSRHHSRECNLSNARTLEGGTLAGGGHADCFFRPGELGGEGVALLGERLVARRVGRRVALGRREQLGEGGRSGRGANNFALLQELKRRELGRGVRSVIKENSMSSRAVEKDQFTRHTHKLCGWPMKLRNALSTRAGHRSVHTRA